MLDKFDFYILKLCAALATQQFKLFDLVYLNIATKASFKFGPIIMCLWIIWFDKREPDMARRSVLNSVMATFSALFVCRFAQNFFSERPRPLHSGNPEYVMPNGVDPNTLKDWSSFPSDHAAMAFALSTGIFIYSRPIGIFCYFWSLIFVCIPRIYAGLHYATDIIGGAIIGIFTYMLFHYSVTLTCRVMTLVDYCEKKYTGAFYAVIFFLSLQLVTMFDDIRQPIEGMLDYLGVK